MFGFLKSFFRPEPVVTVSDDFLPWRDSFKLGIRSVDNDHRMLFELVNNFERSVRKKESTARVTNTLSALEDYVAEHFAREEKYLAAAKYPMTQAHHALHQNLKQDLDFYKRSYVSGPESFNTAEFLGFLRDWLKDHILSDDQAYVPWVKGER